MIQRRTPDMRYQRSAPAPQEWSQERRVVVPEAEREALMQQLRRALALLLRHQIGPGSSVVPPHLLASPEAVRGALPGSAADWKLRIDYTQHAGSAMVRFLDLLARGG